MFENWKILKSELNNKIEEYGIVANWCNNSHQYHIEDDGTHYKVVKNHEPTIEEKQSNVKAVRNNYLAKYDFTQLSDAPFTEEEKQKYAQYRQYLRDYTNQENWWEQNPLTFEEWSATNAF